MTYEEQWKRYEDYWDQDPNNCGGCEICVGMFGPPPPQPDKLLTYHCKTCGLDLADTEIDAHIDDAHEFIVDVNLPTAVDPNGCEHVYGKPWNMIGRSFLLCELCDHELELCADP